MMKRWTRSALLALMLAAAACAPREQMLVLLSTNAMHARIQYFPQLAAAVAACRDTVPGAVLVDAGDRWTGNAYVDLAPTPGMPVIALMNRLGYDAATLGNHEFDRGQAFLGRMIDSMDFEVVCANVVSDTCTFPSLPPATVIERDGVKIGLVGAVTNYEGPGHPAGNASSFEGLRFPDPQQRAMEVGAELRPKVDVLVLLSHMGDDRDAELLGRCGLFDVVIGGHTHVECDTVISGTLMTQTGKNLSNVGVTTIRLRGGKVVGSDFRIVPLAGYEADPEYRAEVERYYADPELNRPVGEFARPADGWGVANWMARAVADRAGAEVGFYHVGGVRIDSIPAGDMSTARVYDLEPFGTEIAVMRMTPADMRRMILTKYNDTENRKEAHRIDLISTTPYEILVDARDSAFDVRFPQLREGRGYRVALNDYVFRNYRDLNGSDGRITGEKVAGVLLGELDGKSPIEPDNRPRQRIVRAGANPR